MREKMKKIITTVSGAMYAVSSSVVRVWCDTEDDSTSSSTGDTLFSSSDANTTAIGDLASFYHHWFVVVLLILGGLGVYFKIKKDDKALGYVNGAMVSAVVLFILSFESVYTKIVDTLSYIAQYWI